MKTKALIGVALLLVVIQIRASASFGQNQVQQESDPLLFSAGAAAWSPPSLEILIPLYQYPNWYDAPNYFWDDVAAAHSQVPVTAIINPNDGPDGGPPNADYVQGLTDLRDANVTILGYVYTDYGNRDIALGKADVDLYDQHFNIDGIFFDEASDVVDDLAYYQELYDYVQARPNLEKVVLNPGWTFDEEYITQPATHTGVLFEGASSSWTDHEVAAYIDDYSDNHFSLLLHSVPDVATMKAQINLAVERNIGYVYLTDDIMPNPWNSLPSFWQEMLDYISEINAPPNDDFDSAELISSISFSDEILLIARNSSAKTLISRTAFLGFSPMREIMETNVFIMK